MKNTALLALMVLLFSSSLNAQKFSTSLDMGFTGLNNETIYDQIWALALSHDYNLIKQFSIGITGGVQNYTALGEKGDFWTVPLSLGFKYKATTAKVINPLVSIETGYILAMNKKNEEYNGVSLVPGIGARIIGITDKSLDIIVQYHNQFKEFGVDNKLISGIGIKLKMQL